MNEHANLQPKEATTPTRTVPPIMHEVLRSPSQPLDSGTRAEMEPRFGHDFGQVRVHTSARAASSARCWRTKLAGKHVLEGKQVGKSKQN